MTLNLVALTKPRITLMALLSYVLIYAPLKRRSTWASLVYQTVLFLLLAVDVVLCSLL
ncbi:MAG: hypothetical protein I8H75_01715 [Myxococcaceae bacterium]|nr:hypothetical protein [Myxococcaceae bacterium]